MLAKYHPYIQASIVTGNNYAKFLNIQKGGKIYGDKYKFDYKDSKDCNNSTTIFVGDGEKCVVITIEYYSPQEALIQIFKHLKDCDITKNLPRQSGTRIFMLTTLAYLKKIHKIKYVTLTDSSSIQCGETPLSLSKLYLFKYNSSYYKQNFGFKYEDNKDNIKLQQNIEKLKTHYCNKTEILRVLLLNKFDKTRVEKFVSKINDNELVSKFVQRYIVDSDECDIFFKFIEYMYESNMYNDIENKVLYKHL
jgi:hypothetical protein